MGKGSRIKNQNLDSEVQHLRAQNRRLHRELSHVNIVMGCLVKRLGAVLANKRGWTVLVTDEELTALDGSLEAYRDLPKAGIVLTLYRSIEGTPSSSDTADEVQALEAST